MKAIVARTCSLRRGAVFIPFVLIIHLYCFLLLIIHLNVTLVDDEELEKSTGTNPNSSERSLQKMRGPWVVPNIQHLRDVLSMYPDEEFLPPVYNTSISNVIPLYRDLPDTRPSLCRSVDFDVSSMPHVTVVIAFHNEALSILLRAVYSVLKRSPSKLLEEIILVDDGSTILSVKYGINKLAGILPKVNVIRNDEQEGLTRARMRGARRAKGQVLIFLDVHIECNVNWLEPLLFELQRDHHGVMQPTIDVINKDDLTYNKAMEFYRGGFRWDLRFAWVEFPYYLREMLVSETSPYNTPVLSGNAIAVWRDYFFLLGAFDEELLFLGGEQVDFSFRFWMCGGRILTLPCSRVGHILKYDGDGNNNILRWKNLRRVSMIWLEEYEYIYNKIALYYDHLPMLPVKEIRSIKVKRQELKQRKCKSFKWYLKHVFPEIMIPPRDTILHGQIMNKGTSGCFTVLSDGFIGVTHNCSKDKIIPKNEFSLTENKQLMYGNNCVGVDKYALLLKVDQCEETTYTLRGQWIYEARTDEVSGALRFTGEIAIENHCATHVTAATVIHKGEQMVQILYCEPNSMYQEWQFTYRLKM